MKNTYLDLIEQTFDFPQNGFNVVEIMSSWVSQALIWDAIRPTTTVGLSEYLFIILTILYSRSKAAEHFHGCEKISDSVLDK